MKDAGTVATRTARRNFGFVTAEVAAEGVGIGVEGEGEVTVRAEGLPATVFADGERRRTSAIMKNQSLMFIFKISFDFCQKLIGEVAITEEVVAIFKVDNGDFRVESGSFGLLGELNKRMFGFREIIIGEVRGGGAKEAGDLEGASHEAGKTSSGITRGVFLVVGSFVGFVDNNEAKIMDGGKEGRTRADDNEGGGRGEDFEPDLAALD